MDLKIIDHLIRKIFFSIIDQIWQFTEPIIIPNSPVVNFRPVMLSLGNGMWNWSNICMYSYEIWESKSHFTVTQINNNNGNLIIMENSIW